MQKSLLDVHGVDPVDTRNYVDGTFIDGASARIPTYDPASGEVLAEVDVADAAVVDNAVAAARRGLAAWSRRLPAERARCLHKVAALLRRDADRLARLESLDAGKPLREARGDIETSARYFEYYAGVADKLQGDSIPLGEDFMSLTVKEPVGVTAHIIPWNFPLVTTARGAAPALAAGCSAVIKPAEQTPLSALALARIVEEAGLPSGAYNVVCGDGATTGSALVAHPGVDHVTFTGSVVTGKRVMRSAADHMASVTLELGGKSPVVVLNDADIDLALAGTLKAIFTNAGQVCSAGARLVVEEGIAERFLPALTAATNKMHAGRGIDDPDLGPLVSLQQLNKVEQYVTTGRARGIQALCGGERLRVAGLEGGWFFAPTLMLCPNADDPLVQDEIFGPVLVVQVARDAAHAIELANATSYGLVAGIYTRDVSRALRFARDVCAGQVFVNQYFAGGVETPFGGRRNSGFGRVKGLAALQNYIALKTITFKI